MTKRLLSFINLICILTWFFSICLVQGAYADSTSANKGYALLTTGTNRGLWGISLNNNFNLIDNNVSGYLAKSVAGSSNITVSASDGQYLYHRLTGALTGNIQYILPAGGLYIIDNETTGSYTLTVDNTLGGTGVVVTQGSAAVVYSDATNSKVVAANSVISGVIASANGGTGSAYFGVSGPTSARTYAFPDASATVLTSNAAVTVPQGGTGVATLASHGVVLGQGTSPVAVSGAGTSGQALISNGASADPTFQNIPASSAATTSAAGIVQLATTIVAKAGTDATQALTPASVAGNSSIGTNGYYILPGGLIEQWGKYAGGSNGPSISFPTAFASGVYSITVTGTPTFASPGTTFTVTTTSTSAFTVDQRNSSGGAARTDGFYWRAVGK